MIRVTKSRLCYIGMIVTCALSLKPALTAAQETSHRFNLDVDAAAETESSPTPGSLPGDRQTWQNAYILGPGDRIRITALEAPDYSGEFLVLPDGTLDLPRSGSIVVQGMTLDQAKQAIATHYAAFLRRPIIETSLLAPRSIRVGISGEVNRPGSYTVGSSTAQSPTLQLPTLTEALQVAGGITSSADLRQIQLRRPLGRGQEQVATINLWDLIETGDLGQDLLIQGGDTIFVPTAQAISPQEAVQLGTASFAPETIRVYVVGEVRTPGAITIQPNAPLNQAILAAGGFVPDRAETDEVRLIRQNPDGTASQREIPIDFNQGISDRTNPTLQANDVIVVNRSGLTRTIDGVNPIVNLLRGILSIIF